MPRLLTLNTKEEQTSSPLHGDVVTFGKSAEVDLRLDGRGVSRLHGRFFRSRDGRWWVQDLGSRNGILVNDRLVHRCALTHGDMILVGDLALRFEDDTSLPTQANGLTSVTISGGAELVTAVVDRSADSIRAMDARRLTSLYEISKRLLDEQDVLGLVDIAAAALIAELHAAVVVLGLTRNPEQEPDRLLVRPTAAQGAGITLSRSILCRTLEHGRAILVADTSADHALVQAHSIVAGDIRSALCVPLLRRQQVSGFIYVDNRRGSHRYDESDLEFASAVGAMVGTAIENARLRESESARQRMEAELNAARRVQQAIMPSQWVKLDGWDIHGVHSTCHEVGGDYYDAILSDTGHLWLVIADVCGKGAPAALLASIIHAATHALVEQCTRPSELLARLNTLLLKRYVDASFVTCQLVRITPSTGEALIGSAGHPDPIHLSPAGEVRPIPIDRGTILGFFAEADYHDTSCSLADPLSGLLMYTDGLSETVGPCGTFFEERKLWEVLTQAAGRPPSALLQHLQDEVDAFRGTGERTDDLTLLACRRMPPPAGAP